MPSVPPTPPRPKLLIGTEVRITHSALVYDVVIVGVGGSYFHVGSYNHSNTHASNIHDDNDNNNGSVLRISERVDVSCLTAKPRDSGC